MGQPEPWGQPGTYTDGLLVHIAYGSMVQGLCFKRCENPGDPYQVKSPGLCIVNKAPTCLRCIVWVEEP